MKKVKLVVLAVVLAALTLPGAGWAVFQSCEACPRLGPNAQCTCPPGTGGHYIFTVCSKYPASCQLAFKASDPQSEKSDFLKSLAQPSAPSSASAK